MLLRLRIRSFCHCLTNTSTEASELCERLPGLKDGREYRESKEIEREQTDGAKLYRRTDRGMQIIGTTVQQLKAVKRGTAERQSTTDTTSGRTSASSTTK